MDSGYDTQPIGGDDNDSLPDEIKTVTSEVLGDAPPTSYGSIGSLDEEKYNRKYIPTCGLIFYILGFLGLFCSLCLRQVTYSHCLIQ